EREEAETELAAVISAEQAAADDLRCLDRERAETEQSLLVRQDAVTAAQAEVERKQAVVADLRVEVAGLQDRLDQARNEQARLFAAAAVRDGRLSQLETERRKLQAASTAALDERRQVEASETIMDTLAQRRRRLSELGPVNVMAIDEHREMQERLRFLTAQEEDLTHSIASLKAIIARINRTTKRLFMETFQSLQGKFNEMFQTFFGGGRAELILMEDEETNEPGVDIVAQPPGKRLKNIAMLSGGERALTAMALIFASFLIRPTPFCVLDEIDAPLDEENTLRFTRVLRELAARTQFIVITHCKQMMEM